MPDHHRLTPATSRLDLAFQGGEDATVELVVVDDDGVPLPLAEAIATIGVPHCDTVHTWAVDAGNLVLGADAGQVYLSVTRAETAAWARTWGDSEWQLDVRDVFGRWRVPCTGDVRVNPTRSDVDG